MTELPPEDQDPYASPRTDKASVFRSDEDSVDVVGRDADEGVKAYAEVKDIRYVGGVKINLGMRAVSHEVESGTETGEPKSRVRINMGRPKDESQVYSTMGIRRPKIEVHSTVGVRKTKPGSGEAASSSEDEVEAYLGGLRSSSLVSAAEEHGYATVFGGGLNFDSTYHLSPKVTREHRYDRSKHSDIPFTNGFSKAIETGADVGRLVREQPLDRYKFYSSLDLSTPEKEARAQEFMSEVHALAAEQRLAMLVKTEDHNYDSCNIYTWQPEQMAAILEQVYPKYPDIWQSVEHPLQGRVGSADPSHIGFVQEPIGGVNGSHSSRMHKLGSMIDAAGGNLDIDTWKQACADAGVRPDAPWLISDDAAAAYVAERNAREKLR